MAMPEIDVTKINPAGALTIDELCALDKISRATYFRIRNEGRGPVEMREGKSVTISPEARAQWHRERERHAKADTASKKRLAEHGRKGGRAFAKAMRALRRKAKKATAA
jgi:hypothetical protein